MKDDLSKTKASPATLAKGGVTPEMAEKEVESWLDFKRIKQTKRESYSESASIMAEAIALGDMVLDPETHHLTVSLAFPLGDSESIKTLKIRPRVTINDINKYTAKIKDTATALRVQAMIACICEEPIGVIKGLDTGDYELMQAIVVFFL